MRRYMYLLLVGLLALPAAAQPYDSIREALWALNCRTTGVCDPVRGCPHLDIRAVDLTKDGWPGRGHATRPVHISDGSESKGLTEAKMVAADPANPLRLRNPPRSWVEVAGWDAIDLNIMRCGSQSARQMLIARFLPPALPCPSGWVCDSMPLDVARNCVDGAPGWGCFGLAFDARFCYLRQDSPRGTTRISYNKTRPECVPETVMDGANPPPPPDPCGDRTCDAAAGETHASCPADCDSPEPPPPPEGDECSDALDALRAALEAAEVCRP